MNIVINILIYKDKIFDQKISKLSPFSKSWAISLGKERLSRDLSTVSVEKTQR